MSLDYIFGKGVHNVLRIDKIELSFSKRTGRVKMVFIDGKLLATIRSDGSIALTVFGASLFIGNQGFLKNCVVVKEEAEKFIAEGRSVFAKHVIRCGDRVRPASDVAILNVNGKVIAVGRAVLSSKMIRDLDRGMAVKIREVKNKHSIVDNNA